MKILAKKAGDVGVLSLAEAVKALKSLEDSLPKAVQAGQV
jgi:hypothetical protein